jgi:RNA polymerase sigma-70 factor (ECF subfamily)
MQAWAQHQAELRGWLQHRLGDAATAQDLLQDVFLKALRQGERFCSVANARAWLFEVARNTLTDHLRRQHPTEPLPLAWLGADAHIGAGPDADVNANLNADVGPGAVPFAPDADATPVVDQLTGCLQRVLTEMAPADADIIRQCDLGGMRQQDYAAAHGLGLPATKARLQRARQRLRQAMTLGCQIQTTPGGGVIDFIPR